MGEASEPKNESPGRRFKLGDLKRSGARTEFHTAVLTGFNMGNRTLSLTMTMDKFKDFTDVANEARIVELGGDRSEIAQRPLDKKHASAIAMYMLRGLLVAVRQTWIDEGRHISTELDDLLADFGHGPYQALQPFTGNIRTCAPGGADLDLEEKADGKLVLFLRQGQLIYIIDGQHRRYAYEMMVDWLKDLLTYGKYKRRSGFYVPDDVDDTSLSASDMEIWAAVLEMARSHFTVDITVHLGLTPDAEKQLFHDLNNRGKKPDAALAQAFDQANPISVFIRSTLEAENVLGNIKVADSGSKKGKKKPEENEPAVIYRDDLVSANSMLFAGATNQASVVPSQVAPFYDYGCTFWKALASQDHFGADGWAFKTLLSEPVMIKALAQLAYTYHGSREKDHALRDRFLDALANKEIDFSHQNPQWAIYFKPETEWPAIDPALIDYLTPDAGRKSYGFWQGERLEFAQNTRDIARYLGDLIRWKLKLPPRPGITTLKTKLINQGKIAAPAKAA